MELDSEYPAGVWSDVYAETSFDPGTPVIVYSKSAAQIYLWESSSPPAGLTEGVPVWRDPFIADQNGVSGLWVCSTAAITLSVQENTDA